MVGLLTKHRALGFDPASHVDISSPHEIGDGVPRTEGQEHFNCWRILKSPPEM